MDISPANVTSLLPDMELNKEINVYADSHKCEPYLENCM